MPDVKDYKKNEKQKFMDDCMHQVDTVEKKPHDQSVAQCLGMWGEKGKSKKRSASLECISSKVRKCASAIEKLSAPYMTFKGQHVDFHFEKLDLESIHKVIEDIFAGKTISL